MQQRRNTKKLSLQITIIHKHSFDFFLSFIFYKLAESPSRRVLLDYPSPYLYGNYHTSPSEDLVALWLGANGTGTLNMTNLSQI